MAAPQQPRSVTVVMDLGFRSDPNLHRAQSGPPRVRIEAWRCGWWQYNLWEMTVAGQIEPSSSAKESGKRNRVRDRNLASEKHGRRLRRDLLHEFSEASAIYRPVGTFTPGTKRLFAPSPAPHRLDESQPVIPRRVALLHCPLPLHRLSSRMLYSSHSGREFC